VLKIKLFKDDLNALSTIFQLPFHSL